MSEQVQADSQGSEGDTVREALLDGFAVYCAPTRQLLGCESSVPDADWHARMAALVNDALVDGANAAA